MYMYTNTKKYYGFGAALQFTKMIATKFKAHALEAGYVVKEWDKEKKYAWERDDRYK